MKDKQRLLELIGEVCNSLIPCKRACTVCARIIVNSREQSIEEFWKRLVSKDSNFYPTQCSFTRKLHKASIGSILEIRNFCVYCENPSNLENRTMQASLRVHDISEPVQLENFGLSMESGASQCQVHNERRMRFLGFSMIPLICVLKHNRENDGFIPTSGYVIPLRFIFQKTHYFIYKPFNDQFNSKLYFIPNPMSEDSLKCRYLEYKILGLFSEHNTFYHLIEIKGLGDGQSAATWTISDIILGRPFSGKSGIQELKRSLYFTTENDFENAVLVKASCDVVKDADGEVQETREGHERIIGIVPTNTEPCSSRSSNTISDDVDGSNIIHNNDSNSTENYSMQIADMDHTHIGEHHGNISSGMIRSISSVAIPPILNASVTDLQTLNYCNPLYIPAESSSNEDLKITVDELINSIEDRTVVPGISPSDAPSISYFDNAIYGEEKGFLQMFLDIDSIDVISKPWSLMAYNGDMYEYIQYFKNDMRESEKYLDENCNLLLNFELPGLQDQIYFASSRGESILNHVFRDVHHPIAVTVFRMQLPCSLKYVGIRAMIPGNIIGKLKNSCFLLLKLFHNKVNKEVRSSIQENSLIQVISQFCWYVITQLFGKLSTLVTRSLSFPTSAVADPCCAVSTKRNCSFHDRSAGPGSGSYLGLKLSKEEFKGTSHLLVRFFVCLELVLRIPEEKKVFQRNERIGSLDVQTLNHLNNMDDSTKEILQEEHVSDTTINFYKSSVWNGDIVGNLISLSFHHPENYNEEELNGIESSRRAFESGFLNLQDLALFTPVLFRLTIHGLKYNLLTYESALTKIENLKKRFCSEHILDSIVDIGCTMKSPKGENWDIVLPACSTLNTDIILPLPVSQRSHSSLQTQGCSVYSGMGYPNFADISTKKLKPNDRAPYTMGIRRVKCYSSSRHSKTTRGKSLYEGIGDSLMKKLSNSSKLLCQWIHQRPTYGINKKEIRIEQKEETQRTNMFKMLMHEIERRKNQWNCDQGSIGIRTELTIPFIDVETDLMDSILFLIKASDLRSSMTEEEFRTMREGSDNDDLSPNSEQQKMSFSWPWWTDLHSVKNISNTQEKSILPVVIFKNSKLCELEFTLEQQMLKKAFDIYTHGRAVVSGNSRLSEFAPLTPLTDLYPSLGMSWVTHICLLFSRAFLSTAKSFSVSQFCNPKNMCWNVPPFLMSSLGLDASWYQYGYPLILMGRVLSLHEIIYNAAKQTVASSECCEVLKILLNNNDLSEQKDYTALWDDRTQIPRQLHFSTRSCKRKFGKWIFGFTEESYTSIQSIIENDSTKESHTSSNPSLYDEISIRMSNYFDIASMNKFRKSLKHISVLIVSLLISDFYYSLEKTTAVYGRREIENRKKLETKKKPGLDSMRIKHLAETIDKNIPWEDKDRIVSLFEGQRKEKRRLAYLELNENFVIPRNLLLGNIDDGNCEGHNVITNRDGSITYRNFIHTLLSIARTLPCYTRSCGSIDSENVLTGSWRSIYALRILLDFIELEMFEQERMPGTKFVKKIFEEEFPYYLQTCMKHSGFETICPRLECESDIRLDAQCRIIPWCEKPYLSWLQMTSPDESISMTIPERMVNSRRMRRMTAITLKSIKPIDYEEILTSLKIYTRKSSELQETIHKHKNTNIALADQFEKYIISETKSIVLHMVKTNCIHDLIEYKFNIMHANQEFSHVRPEYLKPSKAYAVRLIEGLLYMRSIVVDEGFACCKKPDGCLISLRDADDSDLNFIRRTFKSQSEVWNTPWPVDFYPSSMRSANGKLTKKINMNVVSKLLYHSGIVFRPIARARSLERRTFKHDAAKGYRNYFVRHIFGKFEEKDEASCISSRAMWRLKPTSIIVKQISNCFKVILSERS